MLQELASTFQQITVGAAVTVASSAVAAIGAGLYRYLTRSVPKVTPNPSPEWQDATEAETVRTVVIVQIGSEPQRRESLPVVRNQWSKRS